MSHLDPKPQVTGVLSELKDVEKAAASREEAIKSCHRESVRRLREILSTPASMAPSSIGDIEFDVTSLESLTDDALELFQQVKQKQAAYEAVSMLKNEHVSINA